MATLINKMVSWAAREAEQLAAKSGISLEKAAEEIADKYGQKAFAATTAASKSTALVPVGEVIPRTAGEIRGPARLEREVEEKARPGAIRDPFADENLRLDQALKQSQPVPASPKEQLLALPEGKKFPKKSDTSASEDYEASFGNLDTGISGVELPKAGKVAAGAGALGTALSLGGDLGKPSAYSDVPEGTDKQELNASLQKALQDKQKELENKPTEEIKKEVKKNLNTANDKANKAQDEADKGNIPQAAADRFKDERDQAYQMYNEAKSRNEWLELAQILGQAVTQFGAAQVGMRTGRSMAGLQIPGIDYGARTAQEQRLLETRLRDIGGEQEREERLAERLRREELDRQRLGLERRKVALEEKESGMPKESAEEREIRREERVASQKEFTQKKEAIQKALGAQQIIASEVTNIKAKQKAQEVLAEESAKAGLDLASIIEQSQVPGLFGTSTDQKAVLTNIKAALKQLEEGRQRAPIPATMQTQAPAGTVTVIHKATGQSRQYPAGSPEAERAKSDPDFEVR